MTERVLPSNVDYLDRPPKAIPSERKRRKYYPANGTLYRAGQTIVIEIADSRCLLDPANSFLEFTYQNLSAQTLGFDVGGGSNFIRTLRCVQAGNEIMRINNYNRLISAIVFPTTNRFDKVNVDTLTNADPFAGDGAGGLIANGVMNGVDVARNRQENDDRISATGDAGLDDHYRFCVPLHGGLFSQDKFIPLPLLKEPLQIHIDLEPDGRNIGCYETTPAEANDALYQLTNVSYTSELVEVPRMVLDNLRNVQARMGGSLIVQAQSYEHFNNTTAAGFSGETNIRIPSRKKSMKSLLWVCKGDEGTIATSFTDGIAVPIVAGSVAKLYNLSFSANPFLSGYQIKAGSLVYPPQKIQAPSGNGVGGTAINGPGALARRGEALNEVLKAFGYTGTMVGSALLNNLSYANNNLTIAPSAGEAAVDNFGADFVSTTGAVAPNPAIVRPVNAGAIGNLGQGLIATPFALDLEAFQKDAVLSGIDTETMALQMELIVDIDNGQALQLEAVTWDIYVWHDVVYYFNADGTITYSQ